MPRKAIGLTAAKVRTAGPGRYGDGGGLYLLVRPTGARFWLFRYVIDKRMREMGLGAASGRDAVTLADARVAARKLWEAVRVGRDPLADRAVEVETARAAARASEVRAKTFREVAQLYIDANEAGWDNAKHRAQWSSTLETYAFPHLGDLSVADVTTERVMAALAPIWRTKTETATRLRGRIESVLDYAKVLGWRTGENPALWRGHLAKLLPKPSKVRSVVNHPALPWREMGSFMENLRTRGGLPARALELTILTAARTGEVLGARWTEFDLAEAIWRIPAARMKARREHRVPLSEPALAVLNKLLPMRDPLAGDWVVPGARERRPLSNMAMDMLLRRMGRDHITVHGFRSAFRTWSAEATGYAGEIAEAALAHVKGDRVEAAYQRTDFFEKRRRLMDDWAAFCARR
jgi:integrase